MKGGAHPSPFAALSFPNSKKVPIYCWVDRESFPAAAQRSRASTHAIIAELLLPLDHDASLKKGKRRNFIFEVPQCICTIVKNFDKNIVHSYGDIETDDKHGNDWLRTSVTLLTFQAKFRYCFMSKVTA